MLNLENVQTSEPHSDEHLVRRVLAGESACFELVVKPIVYLFCLVSAAGCGGSKPPESPASATGGEAAAPAEGAPVATPAPATFPEQVAQGQMLYGQYCARCHGASGEGGKAPAVIGLDKGALPLEPPASAKYRKTRFKTVADIADFVVKNMPAGAPGTLTEEQYFAILAFDLKANGIDLGQKKLDATLAPTLDVPRGASSTSP